jgi:hypothetical protein
MTDPAYRGPGIRGLVPGPGDQILVDHRHVPGLAHPHWFRATKVRELPDAVELAGWLIGREDLGEIGISEPFSILVARPAELVVRRHVDAPPIHSSPDPVPLPGLVAELIEPTWQRPVLPASVEDVLAHPERHEHRRDLPRSGGARVDRRPDFPGGDPTAMTRRSAPEGRRAYGQPGPSSPGSLSPWGFPASSSAENVRPLQCAYLRPGVTETGRYS